ncbi:MAG: hypothetical protein JXB03_13105 [Spirochaetales bacterium]|nr:hypothetical protein [Spirochaetales bacterium]
MKKILLFVCILIFTVTAFGQSIDFSDLQSTFDDFATDIAPTIPTLANVGLQWSDAWIGNIPHFGVGATIGTAFVPVETFEDVFTAMGQDSGVLGDFPSVGIPLPAVSVEGRIGGFILPFDVGIKGGFIPGALTDLSGDAIESLEYQMFGFDVRYALVKQNLVLPNVSIGVGYTNLMTKVKIPLGGDQTVDSWQVPIDNMGNTAPYTLTLADPAAEFGWTSNIIDLKAQVSKSFLILTPYVGAGVSFGLSNVGGGISANPVISDGTDTYTVEQVRQQFENYGMGDEFPDVSSTGISFYGDTNAPSFRVFGGTSLNLFLMKVDISAMINPVTRAFGGQLNVRLEL